MSNESNAPEVFVIGELELARIQAALNSCDGSWWFLEYQLPLKYHWRNIRNPSELLLDCNKVYNNEWDASREVMLCIQLCTTLGNIAELGWLTPLKKLKLAELRRRGWDYGMRTDLRPAPPPSSTSVHSPD